MFVVASLSGGLATGWASPQENAASSASQAVTSDIDRFVRISVDADGDQAAMQTSIVRYEGTNDEGQPFYVDLIGVVHIGEQAYYDKLNQRFEMYDALLYELVAPEGTVVPRGGEREGGMNPIASIQKGMQSALGLQFQLDHIDYTVDNFVHADMSPEEFMESMQNNNESLFKTFFRAMGQGMAKQQKKESSETDMLVAALSGDQLALRRAMAVQLQDLESGMLMFEGENGSTIIHHRNRKALGVLSREIKQGRTRLGVFYGAGHLPDMEEKLLEDFGLQRAGTIWLDAWDLGNVEK